MKASTTRSSLARVVVYVAALAALAVATATVSVDAQVSCGWVEPMAQQTMVQDIGGTMMEDIGLHLATDIIEAPCLLNRQACIGRNVMAIADGIIERLGVKAGTYEDTVVLKHIEPLANAVIYSFYGHLRVTGLRVGQTVTAGQVIGTLANLAAHSMIPHLHMSIFDQAAYNKYLYGGILEGYLPNGSIQTTAAPLSEPYYSVGGTRFYGYRYIEVRATASACGGSGVVPAVGASGGGGPGVRLDQLPPGIVPPNADLPPGTTIPAGTKLTDIDIPAGTLPELPPGTTIPPDVTVPDATGQTLTPTGAVPTATSGNTGATTPTTPAAPANDATVTPAAANPSSQTPTRAPSPSPAPPSQPPSSPATGSSDGSDVQSAPVAPTGIIPPGSGNTDATTPATGPAPANDVTDPLAAPANDAAATNPSPQTQTRAPSSTPPSSQRPSSDDSEDKDSLSTAIIIVIVVLCLLVVTVTALVLRFCGSAARSWRSGVHGTRRAAQWEQVAAPLGALKTGGGGWGSSKTAADFAAESEDDDEESDDDAVATNNTSSASSPRMTRSPSVSVKRPQSHRRGKSIQGTREPSLVSLSSADSQRESSLRSVHGDGVNPYYDGRRSDGDSGSGGGRHQYDLRSY